MIRWLALVVTLATMPLTAEQARAVERFQAVRAELDTRACERSFRAYVPKAWGYADPAPFVPNWHLDAVADHLQGVSDGHITRLCINMPPGQAKSMSVAVLWPTWQWGPARHPGTRMLFTSYSLDNPVRDAVRARRVLESDWYQGLWGDRFQLTGDQNVKSFYENDKGGARLSIGKAGATGKRGDWVIIDDPTEITHAANTDMLEKTVEAFDSELSSRVNDPKTGCFIIVMQRLNERDLAGHVLARGGYTHLCLPMAFEAAHRCRVFVHGALFFEDPRQTEGELLCPARFSEREAYGVHPDGTPGTSDAPVGDCEKVKKGSFGWAGQYQQRPIPLAGALVKRSWFRFYTELPADLEDWLQSWDMSFDDTEDSDYVSGGVWARKGARKYLVHRVHEQLSFTATLEAVKTVSAAFPKTHTKLVEKKANGAAVINSLQGSIPGIIAIIPTESKVSRLNAVSPTIEAGNVWLPDASIAPWVESYISELITFPRAAHDDDVDMTTQALLRYQDGGSALLEFWKAEAAKTQAEAAAE